MRGFELCNYRTDHFNRDLLLNRDIYPEGQDGSPPVYARRSMQFSRHFGVPLRGFLEVPLFQRDAGQIEAPTIGTVRVFFSACERLKLVHVGASSRRISRDKIESNQLKARKR